VSDQVSSLKKTRSGPHLAGSNEDEGLGIENGSFKWNEVVENTADKKSTNLDSESTTGTAIADPEESTDHKFELRNISVLFPEGQLSIITGPTASGKTALLVRVG
jgi:hypothetical protein